LNKSNKTQLCRDRRKGPAKAYITLRVELKNEIYLVQLFGTLNNTTSGVVQKGLVDLITPGCKVVLNINKCDYLSSSGVRALVLIFRQVRDKGGRAVFSGLTKQARDILWATGFDSLIDAYATTDEAIKIIKGEKQDGC